MKGKFLMIAVFAALLVGSSAMAGIPRVAVLGTQPVFTSTLSTNAVNGSLWYDDEYNVFYNPAYVNDNKNYAVIQKGMEGGWFKSEFENFAYGVYVNRGGNGAIGGYNSNAGAVYGGGGLVAPGTGNLANFIGTASVVPTLRPIDLFFGGDTGLKWGVHAAWAYNRDQYAGTNPNNSDAEVTNRYWHFDFGVQVMGFEPFIGTTMFSKYQNTITAAGNAAAELNEFDAGFRYKYEGWTPYFVFKKFRESGLAVAAANQTQTRHNIWGIGVGHDTKVADGVHVLKNVGFWVNSVEDDNGAAGATLGGQAGPDKNKDYKDFVLPINVAIEAEATSWLTLRAGASFDLVNSRRYTSSNKAANASPAALSDKGQSQNGTTNFRLGSTFKFGKLHLDSAFGTGAANTAVNQNGATNSGLDNQSVGLDSQTFALLSASYHW